VRVGIAVVYLVTPGNERLLDLHLEYIERHTTVPYAIYGAAARLDPELRARLARTPHVRLLDLPATGLRGPEEHAYYLDLLVAAAADDGVSHVVTLHVDSFPIRPGWAEVVAAELSESRPLAAAMRDDELDQKPFTAFLCARRELIERHRPTFLLEPAALRSAGYRRYRRRYRVHPDSGVGYGYAAWSAGLEWYPLRRSNRGEDHGHFGSIHGDLAFHLGAAAWAKKDYPGSRRERAAWGIQGLLAGAVGRALPARARESLRRTLVSRLPVLGSEPRYQANEEAFLAVRERLFADPDGYIEFLRTGRRR
jgi:hypothetical protein